MRVLWATTASMIGWIVFCWTLASICSTTCPPRWISPSAGSDGLLCEGLGERAAVVVAQALLKLLGGELAIRLDHGPLAVHPLGLDRVEPRALARQAADQKPAAAVALDPAVVGRDPGAHLAA